MPRQRTPDVTSQDAAAYPAAPSWTASRAHRQLPGGSNISRGEGGRLAMAEPAGDPRLPSAKSAGCDGICCGAITALRESGLSAPENVSIMGYRRSSDEPILGTAGALTAAALPVADAGATLLIERRHRRDVLIRRMPARRRAICRAPGSGSTRASSAANPSGARRGAAGQGSLAPPSYWRRSIGTVP